MADNKKKYSVDEKDIQETTAYKCYKRYHDTFFVKSNLEEVLKECRDFVAGRQYSIDVINDLPKPTFNICREYVEKVSAKILETIPAVSFVADVNTENLNELDNFYDYQMKEIDDAETTSQVAKQGIIDGVGVAVTAFDADTLGVESLFKGFLKRQIIPFEQTFWENPYCEDEQDQQYFGYFFVMEIGAVKELVEGKNKELVDELILPEDYFIASSVYDNMSNSDIDNEVVNVYVRFFRINGEVYFEMATRWCDIYEYPHALNPRINKQIIQAKKKALNKKIANDDQDSDKKITDYDMDSAKYTLFTEAIKNNSKEYKKNKSKFYRYPVSLFRPYPIIGTILGESGVSLIIANQKIVNYIFLLITLIIQSHAMPKILAKPDALKGQDYDNSPNQIITDYTPLTSGVPWGITRLSSGDAVNSNLIDIGTNIIKLTRNINGFDDLISNLPNDTSGYAYQQVVQQANLTLEQPQKRLWKYIKNNARTDIMYFKHYVSKAKYYTKISDSEYEMQEQYRTMSQAIINSGKTDLPNQQLPKTQQVRVKDVDSKMFDTDFNVLIEVEQGIAGSQITESQHYNQVFQYIASGNLDADKIKLLVQNDPAFSAKTRQRIMCSLDALENSQLQIKNQEIAQLQDTIQQLINNLKVAQGNINYLKARDTARDKALKDSINQNKAFAESMANSMKGAMTESEVKAQNAKGISGGSFT